MAERDADVLERLGGRCNSCGANVAITPDTPAAFVLLSGKICCRDCVFKLRLQIYQGQRISLLEPVVTDRAHSLATGCNGSGGSVESLLAGPPVSDGEWTARSDGGPSIRTRVEPEGHRKAPPPVLKPRVARCGAFLLFAGDRSSSSGQASHVRRSSRPVACAQRSTSTHSQTGDPDRMATGSGRTRLLRQCRIAASG